MMSPLEYEGRSLAVHKVSDHAPLKRELVIAVECRDRREVESAFKPWLDLMPIAALHFKWALAIDRVLAATGRAIGEVLFERNAKLRGQGAATTNKEMGACFGAIHALHLE